MAPGRFTPKKFAFSLILVAVVVAACSMWLSLLRDVDYLGDSLGVSSAADSFVSLKLRKGLWDQGARSPRASVRGVLVSSEEQQQAESTKVQGPNAKRSAASPEAQWRTEFVHKASALEGSRAQVSSGAVSPRAEWGPEVVQPKAVAGQGVGAFKNEAESLNKGVIKVVEVRDGTAAAAAPPPPPPPPHNPNEGSITRRILKIIGCILTVLVDCNPIIVFWSTRNNMVQTTAFCTMIDLVASATGTGAWLLFSVVQLHGEDGKVIGLEAVITNPVGLTVLARFITVKLAYDRGMSTRVCAGTLICFATAIGLSVSFALFGPIKRETPAAHNLSSIATFLQAVSQAIPFYSAIQLLCPRAARAEQVIIMNERPLIVYSRSSSFAIYLYWAMYAVLTYQHTMFEWANVLSCVSSFVSLCLHLFYALSPAGRRTG